MEDRIRNFPISFFAAILGLGGFAIALLKAEQILGLPIGIGLIVGYLTGIIFLAMAAAYLTKLLRDPSTVVAEFQHPIKLNFFPTTSISLLLLSIVFLEAHTPFSQWLWYLGTGIQFVWTVAVMGRWMHHPGYRIAHLNPAWFIPVVGNILVPIAGVEHASIEISWFFFAIGLVFWLILFTISMYRIFFHEPLPQKLVPTFFILIAPPAIGFLSYLKLTESFDPFARILYAIALFLLVLIGSQWQIFRNVPFFLSCWAYSFPTAAITIASMALFQETDWPFAELISLILLSGLTALMAFLIVRTVKGIRQGEFCVEEGGEAS